MSKVIPAVRCAIYTRKSSEEGLDQAFNSLDAQREACEAYVKSQVGEGWSCIKAAYDDGGISGGTMDRPALQRLLADIERGLIDCVVVYKVDRLTRSLTDFARIIEVFDRQKVSFVSITQAFNTTSSMGRLTLNVLLSFAQFEREVTGERIRDKIAASKRRGMWMGGMPPLGYDVPTDRTSRALAVNDLEAEQVRDIYQRYLHLKSVNAVRDELARDGIRSKAWVSRAGRPMGGVAFNSGSLFHLLQSRVYLGEITHKSERYPGAHEAIVGRELFDAVQTQLAANTHQRKASRRSASLHLTGKLFDAAGHRMGPTFAYAKSGRRYAYYVSLPTQRAIKSIDGQITRLPAAAFEAAVSERLRRLSGLADAPWPDLIPMLERVQLRAEGFRLTLRRSSTLQVGRAGLVALRSRLAVDEELIADDGGALLIEVSARPQFRGGRTWMVRPDRRAASPRQPDRQLLKGIAQAHAILAVHDAGPMTSPAQQQRARGISDSHLRRIAALAFLAPDVQRAILEGRQPAGLSLQQMIRPGVPLAWADQRATLGFADPSIP